MDQNIFIKYVDEMQRHLFDETPVDQILRSHHNSHRCSRFISMYLLKDRSTFEGLFNKKSEYQLDTIFNKVLTTLLYHDDRHADLKQHFISLLGISVDMITAETSSYEVQEMDKDISSFKLWRVKEVLK